MRRFYFTGLKEVEVQKIETTDDTKDMMIKIEVHICGSKDAGYIDYKRLDNFPKTANTTA